MSDREKKYEKLKKQLEEGFDWPLVYMFKFIVPTENNRVEEVKSLFKSDEATFETRPSRKGNYISITAKEMMMNPEKVIERYLEAEEIDGLISL